MIIMTFKEFIELYDDFVYEGLRQGIFPWGYAVKTSSTWSYYINSMKFTECTGIKVQLEMGV